MIEMTLAIKSAILNIVSLNVNIQSNTDNTNLWGPKKKFVLTDFRVMNYENLDEKVSSNSVTQTW